MQARRIRPAVRPCRQPPVHPRHLRSRAVAATLPAPAPWHAAALLALAALLLLAWPAPNRAAAAEAECFSQCVPERLADRTPLDPVVRDAVKTCRDLCEVALRERLGTTLAAYETCREKDLSDQDILAVRQASGPYFLMLTNFVWAIRNPFPDRVLRSMEIRHYGPTLNELGYEAKTVVLPGETGTFVMLDVNQMLPQLKHTLKIARLTYCDKAG
ncbi:hypothetical protein [Prosthecomicrobium sp. N25]|uniref:hypothetical protein n=1 Tax=Prosthecomicrobium sp. N25 TaxID=3129254 RepID=UPI003076A6A9